jgi:hypothetical protein
LSQIILKTKGGHPQFKAAPPQLRNVADNQIDCGTADLKKLRKFDCGPSKFDFRNSATLSSFLPVPLLSVSFPQLRMVLKINKNIFRVSVSLAENLP